MARNSLKNVARLIDDANKQLEPQDAFLADLKRSIELTANAENRKPSQSYKPSSMRCIRNMYYQMTGAEVDKADNSYSSVGICNSGSDIHIRIQSAVEDMKNNGIDCEYIDVADFVKSRHLEDLEILGKSGMETKLLHKKLNMHFLCDGIIRYKGVYYILEIKSEASFKWNQRKGVDIKHYNQGTAYSIAFNLPDVIFLYISRDMLDMKAYLFTPTDEQKHNLVGMISACDEYVAKKEVPMKPTNLTTRDCAYCSYRSLCNKE